MNTPSPQLNWPTTRATLLAGLGTVIKVQTPELEFLVVARDKESLEKALNHLCGDGHNWNDHRLYHCQITQPDSPKS